MYWILLGRLVLAQDAETILGRMFVLNVDLDELSNITVVFFKVM